MDHNNFADEEFNAGAICPDDMMPISAEEYEPTYRNVPLDCQPQEAEYRGVSMMKGPTQVFDFFPQDHYIEPEDDRYIVTQQNKKMPENFAGVDIKLEMDDISCIDYSFSPICVPQPPIVVLSTSFKCTKSVDDIIAAVNNVFGAIGVSFEFTPALSEYNAVYVKGATYTKFQVHIYDEDDNYNTESNECHEYIIEAQRLCGDGFAFNSIFGEVRDALCGLVVNSTNLMDTNAPSSSSSSSSSSGSSLSSSSNSTSSSSASSPCPLSSLNYMIDPLTDDEKNLFVEPVIKMTHPDASIESQLEGCRLLCDMIVSNVNFREQLCAFGCVDVLMRLMLSDSILVSQHAVIALTALSTCESCIESIWATICAQSANAEQNKEKKETGFIEFLCNQFVDGSYCSEAKRRQGAELLTNLLEHSAKQKGINAAENLMSRIGSQAHLDEVNLRIMSPRSSDGARSRSATILNNRSRSATTASSSSICSSALLSSESDLSSSGCPCDVSPRLNDNVLECCISRIQVVLEKELAERLTMEATEGVI